MSTRARQGPFREDDGLNKPLFRKPAPNLRRMVWRDLHPLLLRSAGVVGLAGVIVAVIASAPLADRPDRETGPALSASSQQPPESPPPSGSQDTPAAAAQRLAALSTSEQEAGAPPKLVQAAALTVQQRAARARELAETPSAAPQPLPAWDTPAAEPAPQAGQAAPADTRTAARSAIRTALAPSAPAEPKGDADTSSLWAEDATNCLRDWLAPQTSEPSATGTTADCDDRPTAPLATPVAPEQPTAASEPPLVPAGEATEPEGFSSAALNLAPQALPSEGLTDGFVAPVPRIRPEPPPPAVKKPTRTKTAARGKLGPPPNCGKKYARWRYVNKQPTWYCK